MEEVTYPRIKYQGVPRAPLENIMQNPGYVYVKVDNADAEKALEGDWHDTPGDAAKSVAKDAKLTAAQYALVAAQATERGATPPAMPKFDDAQNGGDAAKPADTHPHKTGPSDPSAQLQDPSDKPRNKGEWPTESARKR